MEEKEIQFGEALTADFQENTFTFEMESDFKVIAGKYAIMPIDLYRELREDLVRLQTLLNDKKL